MAREANDLLHGTLDLLVLKTLSWEPMHGYGITKWIEQATKGVQFSRTERGAWTPGHVSPPRDNQQ